ncbi:MAG: glycosyltransferase family 4 protein [Victivallales bacterium]|nr:glycosyltransferase family 4 protein [Victivallales bacterium]
MERRADILLDATVVRQPESGVQRAVRREAEELQSLLPSARLCLGGGLKSRPACRVLWQQCVLPFMEYAALYAMAYTAPLLCRRPYLLNVHDVIALTHPDLCSRRNLLQMRALLPSSIRRASQVIVSTSYVATQVKLLFPNVKVEVAPLGVDYDEFAKSEGNSPVSGPYFLFVGNIEPKKGLMTLLSAFLQEDWGAKLVLAGRIGWKCGELLAIIRRFPERVIWLGRVADAQLPALYRNALALIMPSIVEGFGLPVLEAMAAGTPVIHSNAPALTETAGGAGLGFEIGNATALAAAMKKMQDSAALRHELAEAGRKRAKQLTWKRRAQVTASLLEELVQ